MPIERANKICWRGTVPRRDEARALTNHPGDAVLIERGVLRGLVLRCPCGCGDDLLINLDARSGPAWRAYRRRGRLTLYPSYWRDSECGSHFILWNDKVIWCDAWDDGEGSEYDESLRQRVLDRLRPDDFQSYERIAEELDEIPWEVLRACRKLAYLGLAAEKEGKTRGLFLKHAAPKDPRFKSRSRG